jgi:CRP/FNR family transcriptional regulator
MGMPNLLHPHLDVTCTNCGLRPLCLPAGLSALELDGAEHLVATRLRVRRGGALYRVADPFKSLYVLWNGSLKSTLSSDDGREQVAGFHMSGEMVGFDGLGAGSHSCDVVALGTPRFASFHTAVSRTPPRRRCCAGTSTG